MSFERVVVLATLWQFHQCGALTVSVADPRINDRQLCFCIAILRMGELFGLVSTACVSLVEPKHGLNAHRAVTHNCNVPTTSILALQTVGKGIHKGKPMCVMLWARVHMLHSDGFA